MKTRLLFLPVIATVLLAACDRGSSEAQRLADERAALEREKAQLASERAAADRNATEQERAKLAEERAAIEAEKARLAGDKEARVNAERDARVANEREQRLAAEKRTADEMAKRQAAEARERDAREAAQEAAGQARAEQSVDFFYDALDPYGDWVNVDRYGYCWRPHVAPGWRPYTDGGWVFTDYGWTWRANEPFGWAVYHYGRWARVPRLGWIWTPGTEWGPAWVSWRRSDDYVGWAPLPPDAWSSTGFTASVDSYFDIGPGLYAFLRVADFGEPTYVGRVVAPEENVTIINKTVNVTNVTYKTVQNKVTVVNNGPDITVINQHSRRPVQRLAVERMAGGASGAARVENNTLKLSAPVLQNTKPATKPKQVKEDVKAAELDHGWADAKDEAPKIRDHAAKEARNAEDAQRKEAVEVAPAPAEPKNPAPAAEPTPMPRPKPKAFPKSERASETLPPSPDAPRTPDVPLRPNAPTRPRPDAPADAPAREPGEPRPPLKEFRKPQPDAAPATPDPEKREKKKKKDGNPPE